MHAENPVASQAWSHLTLGPVFEADFDMCSVGLRCAKTRLPVRKRTRILTTDPQLAEKLCGCQCPGNHKHGHLEGQFKGQALSSYAEVYPRKLCRLLASVFASRSPAEPPSLDVFLHSDSDADSERDPESADEREAQPEAEEGQPPGGPLPASKYKAVTQKLHVNTGHASVSKMLRLAQRAKAPERVIRLIREFKCPVCEELQVPPSHKSVSLRHTETPNHLVGLDVVQVELKRDTPRGMIEEKFNVLTAVDYATDFAQQILLPQGPGSLARAFHSLWVRPYGPPRMVYVDPVQRWMSGDFQKLLRHNSISLLDSASESHWQLGRVEIAQKILRSMAQRAWRTSDRPAAEVIEMCAAVRNEHLRKHGFSSAQWFLGREPRVPGSLADLTERDNLATQDAVLTEPDFAQKMHCRQLAAHAFQEAHAHEVWTKALKGRNRPMRGPYVVGQMVYVFRRHGRGILSTRFGVWRGPGRVVGTRVSEKGVLFPG